MRTVLEAGTSEASPDIHGTAPGISVLRSSSPAPKVLVAEDERIVALDLVTTLRRLGYQVDDSVATGDEAIAAALKSKPQLVLMDIRLNGAMDGVAAAEAIVEAMGIPVIFLTAHSDGETLRRAKAVQPYSYLIKPFRSADLRCAIEVTLHRHELDVQLREREQWLRTTLCSIHDGVVTTDVHDRVQFMNPVAESLTGWSLDRAMGRRLSDIVQLLSESTGEALQLKDGELLREAALLESVQGEERNVEPSAAPIRDERGAMLGRVFVLRDVGERRAASREIQLLNANLERRVQERTAALEAANRDLTAYSYAMAHDLRSPLRVIDGFSQALIDDLGVKVGESGVAMLGRIRDTAQRMSRLIGDLLQLARMTNAATQPEEVDLSALSAELGAELRTKHDAANILFIVQPNLQVVADRTLLRTVLSHLLSNAWKFSTSKKDACVEFGANVDYGRTVYFVKDNGVGFDMQRAGHLFGAFQRLHGAEYAGDGIGLAIVDRAVRRLGGHVWAVAMPGEGATFFFTLGGTLA